MHTYSLDSDIRRSVYIAMWVIAVSVPALFAKVQTLFGLPAVIGFPVTSGALYGFMHLAFDKGLWRWIPLLGVPDLNGTWTAVGRSSYLDPETNQPLEFHMQVTIRQTFSKLEVFTETQESTSRSTMASICSDHAQGIFRYAFENTPKNLANPELQRHPGLIELRIESKDQLSGGYFSGKHRLRYGEIRLERKKV